MTTFLRLALLALLALPASAAGPRPRLTPPPLFPESLWLGLGPAPDAALRRIAKRIPGLDLSRVRELPLGPACDVLDQAAGRGLSGLDLFTDEGLRGPRAFYLSSATLQGLFARYDLRVLTPYSGRSLDGRDFHMLYLVAGQGRVEIVYDQDRFPFESPAFPGYRYISDDRVYDTIEGPGRLTVGGLLVDFGLIKVRLTRLVKLDAATMRVETDRGARVLPVTPLRRR